MAKIRTKSSSVQLRGLTPALAWIFYQLELFARSIDTVPEIVITSINDGKHGPNSRHYKDEAIDLRSKNFPTLADKEWFRAALEGKLGPKFRVLLEGVGTENEHFHIQVRKGGTFP